MPTAQTAKPNPFWPKVTDLASAQEAAKSTFTAALFVSGVTLAVTVVGLVTGNPIMGLNAWALIDVGLFAAVAVGAKFHSRIAAVAGPVLYAVEKLYGWAEGGVGSPVGLGMAVLIMLLFIAGARGIFAYHGYSKEPQGAR